MMFETSSSLTSPSCSNARPGGNARSNSTCVVFTSVMDLVHATEGGRGFRTKRKQLDPICCPVCGVTLRSLELDSHYHLEMDKLTKLTVSRSRKQTMSMCTNTKESTSGEGSQLPEKCWDTYQKVRSNRQGRLKAKTRKRKADEAVCPVCNKRTSDDLTVHVELCLQRNANGEMTSTEDDIDVEGDGETFEEYEWAGQTRIRASSLLSGGYAAAGMGSSMSHGRNSSEDEDLVVDGDDSQVFGNPQYSERDIVMPTIEGQQEAREIQALRVAIIGNDIDMHKVDKSDCNTEKSIALSKDPVVPEPVPPDPDPVIEALKCRVRELETETASNISSEQYKCLICMDTYKTPVVSICCWHVHCEECWLHTLGAKKLCPQCNMITSPTDLRRVFL